MSTSSATTTTTTTTTTLLASGAAVLLAMALGRWRAAAAAAAATSPPKTPRGGGGAPQTRDELHTTSFSRADASNSSLARAAKPKHALIANAIAPDELKEAFESGVMQHFHEQQLPSYSRYEDWRQSCYMETHPKWTPQPPINEALFGKFKRIQETCRRVFAAWYADLYGLDEVDVTTLNSFVTKYVAVQGKNEFGKHVDGVRVHGSLVLALPTDVENDWPGMLVWDGPKGRGLPDDDPRPLHRYNMLPGDVLVMDRIVWHHGLPISKGHRYVVVNFYSVSWRRVSVRTSLAVS